MIHLDDAAVGPLHEGEVVRRHHHGGTAGVDVAQELEDAAGGAFIEIPGVSIDDRVLTVRILAEPKYNVATADSDGNIIGDVPAIEDQTGSVRMLPEPNSKETN